VAKPTKHGDKWRIRWLDEHGKRRRAVFDDYKRAQTELSRRQVEVEEIRRGVRNPTPPEKTFGDLCDYWIENRAPRKRSQKDDESIIRRHLRPAFGTMRVRDVGVEDVDGYVNVKIDEDGLSEKTINPLERFEPLRREHPLLPQSSTKQSEAASAAAGGMDGAQRTVECRSACARGSWRRRTRN
jgi:hypothetical protein